VRVMASIVARSNRVVGGAVTAANQRAESNGHREPVASAGRLVDIHGSGRRSLSTDGVHRLSLAHN